VVADRQVIRKIAGPRFRVPLAAPLLHANIPMPAGELAS
jgi:hypothetical protein